MYMDKPKLTLEAVPIVAEILEPVESDGGSNLEFKASNIRIIKGNQGEPYAERLASAQMQIQALELAIDGNRLEFIEILDGYYSSKNDEEKARYMTKWLESMKEKKRFQAKISILQEHIDSLSL